jgi:3-oxoadipate enol-lactonase
MTPRQEQGADDGGRAARGAGAVPGEAAPARGAADAPLPHRVSGDGSPLVLLNGGMMTLSSWEPVATRLRERHRVLQLDFRGQLLALDRPVPDLAGHAEDVLALLDHLGWPSAHFVGTSFGAMVGVVVAGRAPHRVRSLVAATVARRETAAFRADRERTAALVAAAAAEARAATATVGPAAGQGVGDTAPCVARERFWDELAAGVYSPVWRAQNAALLAARRAQLAALPAAWFEGVAHLLASLAGYDLGPWLEVLTAPAMVVHAAADRVMSAEGSFDLAQAIEAELVVHPTAGHALVAEDPLWLAEVCLEFLARQELR